MDDRFDQEFYRSRWQRVLPVGPDGIQPYVRTGSSGLSAASPALRRPSAMLAGLARGAIASWRRATIGMARRPLLPATGARAEPQRPWLRLAPARACPDVREPTPPAPLSRAA
jgi:hypothetical protein